jgi:hypothetical protein
MSQARGAALLGVTVVRLAGEPIGPGLASSAPKIILEQRMLVVTNAALAICLLLWRTAVITSVEIAIDNRVVPGCGGSWIVDGNDCIT